MRTRRLLEEDQLNAFMAYCQTHGWTPRRTLGPLETLRMTHPRREPLVIGPIAPAGPSGRAPRYPIYDEASRMYDEWQESMKQATT